MKVLAMFAIALIALTACVQQPPQAPQPVAPKLKPYYKSEAEAIALCKRYQLPMIVVVSEPWCTYCVAMKRDIAELQRAGKIKRLVVLYVDSKSRFSAKVLPTSHLYDKRQKGVRKLEGHDGREALFRHLRPLLEE